MGWVAHKFDEFADLPRFGKKPHITGQNPQDGDDGVNFGPKATPHRRMPSTAIAANVHKQFSGIRSVTHYVDLVSQCVDCNTLFLFFAREQVYWYETLGFHLSAEPLHCFPCRKKHRDLAALKERYDVLLHVNPRTSEQELDLAEMCLTLLEHDVIGSNQIQHVRKLLNRARQAEPFTLAIAELDKRVRVLSE